MKDSFLHKGLRKKLVDEISKKGITDSKILDAIMNIPRHLFLDNAFINFAYQDKAFPIGSGQTISQPYTVAFQTQLLDLKPYQKILEIGTGSGYQAAVLKELKLDVYTIERHKDLFKKTKEFLPSIGYECMFIYGDGYKGLPKFAPFDKILITCGAPRIPEQLIKQLKIGGKMVVPVGEGDTQRMHLIEKISDNENKISTHGEFSFVPMLENRVDND
ncbi:MAG: protein-L-isoaspartate O-methyltransferase [Flavobacteriales bacterium]|nr:protein-L-isoaspartate O-methyltransferase [Flavobacteriales bacterium]|tara:strand:+ start:4925 stop:5575 length:651 start_codon:yes stop_codon:yes gene_type:complete